MGHPTPSSISIVQVGFVWRSEVVVSGLGWGLILYGEEEEKVMAASTDPVMSKVWGVSIFLNYQ